MSDNIQPDGSWRDPTAQMAMDIGLGKVNPNSAGYAAVQQAHQTYGSAHINGLWGHHGNAPTPPGSGRHFASSSSAGKRPFPRSSASAAVTAPKGFGARHRPVVESERPSMSAGEEWDIARDICLGAAVGIVGALVVEFLRR